MDLYFSPIFRFRKQVYFFSQSPISKNKVDDVAVVHGCDFKFIWGVGRRKKKWSRNKVFKTGLLISSMLEEWMFLRLNIFKSENVNCKGEVISKA